MIPDRIPPHDLDAERAVLGALVLYPAVREETFAAVRGEDFYTEAHRAIYAAMRGLDERGEPIELVTLTDALRRDDNLEFAGGPAALALLAEQASIPASTSHYASVVREHAALRETIQVAAAAITDAYDAKITAASLLTTLGDQASAILEHRDPAERPRGPQPVGRVVRELLTALDAETIDAIPSPIPELNERLAGGSQRGEVIYLNGPAAAAKTALALQWAALVASHGHRTIVFSREMTNLALGRRFIAQQVRVGAYALRRGQLDPDERGKILGALPRFDVMPLWFDDSTETITRMARIVRDGDYRFVVIDYLQLVQSPPDSRDERRELEAVSRGIKRIAKRGKGRTVLALSAVSRLTSDTRGSKKKRPEYVLRGSESLAHDADVVLTLYRKDEDSNDRVLEFKKLREGESGGMTTLNFSAPYVTFDEVPGEPGAGDVPF